MNLKHASFFTMLIMGLFLMSCEEDTGLTPDPDEKQGMFELEITDAPVDDPAVKSVFVTISDVQIDDQSLPDFSPVTVDLLTLRNGNTSVLGSDSINVGTYNEIALILDTSDCYIEDVDGNRHQLVAEVEKLEVPYEFSVTEDSAVSLVVDFDLRKTIRRDLNDSIDRYEFAPASDLVNGLRVINKDEAGQLMGQITDLTGQSDMIVAYVYEKGDFDASTEAEVGEDEIQFSNAVTSTLVESDGSYHFAFLEEGEYEMHFASFDEDPVTEEVQLNGVLEVESSVQEEVLNITIEPSSTIEIDLSVTGLLPL